MNNVGNILVDSQKIESIRTYITQGDVCVIKEIVPKKAIFQIRTYLEGVARHSLPNYQPIKVGCPNFHRLNCNDERATVKGCFLQFSFFPWNQDLFNFFDLFRQGYYLKNLLNHTKRDKYLGRTPQDGCIARLSFQFYPAGMGMLNKHRDPLDNHQLAVPILAMSKKGRDFQQGGIYLDREDGRKIFVDETVDLGDLVLFNPAIPHGVDKIDPEEKTDWFSFRGRWMMILATNKLNSTSVTTQSVELEVTEKA